LEDAYLTGSATSSLALIVSVVMSLVIIFYYMRIAAYAWFVSDRESSAGAEKLEWYANEHA
jgi:hypothetical protein